MLNLGARWGCTENALPWSLYPWERAPLPPVQEAGWPQGQSGHVLKILPSQGFQLQTVHPVAHHSTNCTTRSPVPVFTVTIVLVPAFERHWYCGHDCRMDREVSLQMLHCRVCHKASMEGTEWRCSTCITEANINESTACTVVTRSGKQGRIILCKVLKQNSLMPSVGTTQWH